MAQVMAQVVEVSRPSSRLPIVVSLLKIVLTAANQNHRTTFNMPGTPVPPLYRALNVLQRMTLECPSGHPVNSATRSKPAFSYSPGAWKS
jgi:hypothetical protein